MNFVDDYPYPDHKINICECGSKINTDDFENNGVCDYCQDCADLETEYKDQILKKLFNSNGRAILSRFELGLICNKIITSYLENNHPMIMKWLRDFTIDKLNDWICCYLSEHDSSEWELISDNQDYIIFERI